MGTVVYHAIYLFTVALQLLAAIISESFLFQMMSISYDLNALRYEYVMRTFSAPTLLIVLRFSSQIWSTPPFFLHVTV
jgi:hypothetical protein